MRNVFLCFVTFCSSVWFVEEQLHTSRCCVVLPHLQMLSCFQLNLCRCPPPQTLLEFAGRWSLEEEPLPLLEVYIVALLSYVEASPFLTPQCENVQLVVERLSL